eukprot:Skav221450  [mRNA]  locus=scaffold1700:75504:97976:- [translate_table: standard]
MPRGRSRSRSRDGAASHRLMEEETFVPMKQVRRRNIIQSSKLFVPCDLGLETVVGADQRAADNWHLQEVASEMASARLLGQGILMLAAALMVLAPSGAFLLPGASQRAPRPVVARSDAPEESQFGFSRSSLFFVVAAGVIARDVSMRAASPKGKRAHWRTHRDKVRWYRRGELQAKRALALGFRAQDHGRWEGVVTSRRCTMLSPRSGRKPGLQSFTDPMNPFARTMSKAMTNLQETVQGSAGLGGGWERFSSEARADPQRAGARTKNPGMIPVNEGGDRGSLSLGSLVVGRGGFAVYRYGGVEYKPQKRCPDMSGCPTPAPSPRSQLAPSPRSSPGTGGWMGGVMGVMCSWGYNQGYQIYKVATDPWAAEGATEALRMDQKCATGHGGPRWCIHGVGAAMGVPT